MNSEWTLSGEQVQSNILGLGPRVISDADKQTHGPILPLIENATAPEPNITADENVLGMPEEFEEEPETDTNSELIFGAWDEKLLLRMSMLSHAVGRTAVRLPGAEKIGYGFRNISETYHEQLAKLRNVGRVLGRTALMIPGSKKIVSGAKHVEKGAKTLGETYNAFCIDSYLQYTTSESKKERMGIVATAAGTGTSQLADRMRLPEAVTIPLAIKLAEDHGKLSGALALFNGVYVAQYAVGSLWGLGMKKFRKATDVFDNAYPGFKNYAAESNAGYIKTLYRHSLLGLGIGNSAFVGGEVINDRAISTAGVLEKSNRTSRRIATAAGGLLYGLWDVAQNNLDKSIGIPGVVDWTVPEVVENMKKASFWVIAGFTLDIGSRVLEKPVGKAVEIAGKVVGPPAKVVGKAGAKIFGPPAILVAKVGAKTFGPVIRKMSSIVGKVSGKFKKEE